MTLIRRFLWEEDGLSTVEIILILVVLVGLVLIFKEEMIQIVEGVFKTITKQINKDYKGRKKKLKNRKKQQNNKKQKKNILKKLFWIHLP